MRKTLKKEKRIHSALSKVTRKGQITIPVWFRQENGIREGSTVEMVSQGSKLVVESVPVLLDQIGQDRGKYDPAKLKKMLDESRRRWR